jgi:hypothetical protein
MQNTEAYYVPLLEMNPLEGRTASIKTPAGFVHRWLAEGIERVDVTSREDYEIKKTIMKSHLVYFVAALPERDWMSYVRLAMERGGEFTSVTIVVQCGDYTDSVKAKEAVSAFIPKADLYVYADSPEWGKYTQPAGSKEKDPYFGEYRGLLHFHTVCSNVLQDDIVFYAHSKGISYHTEARNAESSSIDIRRAMSVLVQKERIMDAFALFPHVNYSSYSCHTESIPGFYPAPIHAWYNFFAARAGIVKKWSPPIKTVYRYYYERYLGEANLAVTGERQLPGLVYTVKSCPCFNACSPSCNQYQDSNSRLGVPNIGVEFCPFVGRFFLRSSPLRPKTR